VNHAAVEAVAKAKSIRSEEETGPKVESKVPTLVELRGDVENAATRFHALPNSNEKHEARELIIQAAQKIDSAAVAVKAVHMLQEEEAAVLEQAKKVKQLPEGNQKTVGIKAVLARAHTIDDHKASVEKRKNKTVEEARIAAHDVTKVMAKLQPEFEMAAAKQDSKQHLPWTKTQQLTKLTPKLPAAKLEPKLKATTPKLPEPKLAPKLAPTLKAPGKPLKKLEAVKQQLLDAAGKVGKLPENAAKDAAREKIIAAAKELDAADTAVADIKSKSSAEQSLVADAKKVSAMPQGVKKEQKEEAIIIKAENLDTQRKKDLLKVETAEKKVATATAAATTAVNKAAALNSASASTPISAIS